MKHFLNDYMKSRRNNCADELAPLKAVFEKTFRFVREALGDRPFRPERSLNTAVYDAVSFALALKLQSDPSLDGAVTRLQYINLLSNKRFIEGFDQSTADPENVKKRFEEARIAFGVR